MTSKNDLQTAYFDNIRNNQIGGIEDGITEAVAADLGFASYEDSRELIANFTPEKQKAIKDLGSIVCGDCGKVIPCLHAGIRSDGSTFTKGN